MIGFMPEIYPDELLYSRFARFMVAKGADNYLLQPRNSSIKFSIILI